MKKKMVGLAVIAAAVTCLGTGVASAASSEPVISGELNVGSWNKYVHALNGMTVYDRSVFQQSLKVKYNPVGVYATAWSSYSPNGGFDSDFGDEVDWTVGIEKSLYNINFDLSYSYLDLHEIAHNEGDLHEIVLGMSFPEVYEIKPYLKFAWDIPMDEEVLDGGLIYRAGGIYDFSLTKNLSLAFNASISGHDGAFGTEADAISSGRLSITAPWSIDRFTITPEVSFQENFGNHIDDGGIAQDEVVWGLNLSLPF